MTPDRPEIDIYEVTTGRGHKWKIAFDEDSYCVKADEAVELFLYNDFEFFRSKTETLGWTFRKAND